jgi:NitT/TauT family transport system permease protein
LSFRIGSTLAVIGVTVGELVGGNQGLGVLLVQAQGQGDTAAALVTIVMLTLIGIIAYGIVVYVEGRVLHYIPRASKVQA